VHIRIGQANVALAEIVSIVISCSEGGNTARQSCIRLFGKQEDRTNARFPEPV
jgi:hypothetical protein